MGHRGWPRRRCRPIRDRPHRVLGPRAFDGMERPTQLLAPAVTLVVGIPYAADGLPAVMTVFDPRLSGDTDGGIPPPRERLDRKPQAVPNSGESLAAKRARGPRRRSRHKVPTLVADLCPVPVTSSWPLAMILPPPLSLKPLAYLRLSRSTTADPPRHRLSGNVPICQVRRNTPAKEPQKYGGEIILPGDLGPACCRIDTPPASVWTVTVANEPLRESAG